MLPGVDLRVTADALGFSEVLVVKTPAAARNPKRNAAGLSEEIDDSFVYYSSPGLRVPDEELDFDADLFYHHEGKPFRASDTKTPLSRVAQGVVDEGFGGLAGGGGGASKVL